MSAKPLIIERLKALGGFVAIHELKVQGYSENCVATRLSEMAKAGLVIGRYRDGENFKEWAVKEPHQDTSISIKKPLSSPSVPIVRGKVAEDGQYELKLQEVA